MRVLCFGSNANDGCSFYRGMGPLSALAKQRDIDLSFATNWSWGDIRKSDIVFFLRPCTDDLKEPMQAAKDYGVPTWVDWDDDVSAILTDNPMHSFYSKDKIRENIAEFVRGADLLTVSTEALAKVFREKHKNVVVLPNALDDALLQYRLGGKPKKIVLWRGTPTHERDVQTVAKEIVEVGHAHEDYTFVFVGGDPCASICSELLPKVARVSSASLMLYFRTIAAINPTVVIAPLADTAFNRSKSNIAALEGIYAGGAVLAPDWEEWRMPGVMNYGSAKDFQYGLDQMLSDADRTEKNARDGWGFVQDNLLLSSVNKKRLEAMISLVNMEKK